MDWDKNKFIKFVDLVQRWREIIISNRRLIDLMGRKINQVLAEVQER